LTEPDWLNVSAPGDPERLPVQQRPDTIWQCKNTLTDEPTWMSCFRFALRQCTFYQFDMQFASQDLNGFAYGCAGRLASFTPARSGSSDCLAHAYE
jgi:hypothetical protein